MQAYENEETLRVVDDLKLIAKRYLNGHFILDFLAVLPLDLLPGDDSHLWKLLKLLRLPRLSQIVSLSNYKVLLKFILDRQQRQSDDSYSDKDDESKKKIILRKLFLVFAFKIMRIVIVLFSITYFLGLLFYIYSKHCNPNIDQTFITNYFSGQDLDNEDM